MMDSSKHNAGHAPGYRLPEQAWRALVEVETQMEFLAGLLASPSEDHARLRMRLRDPMTLSLCLRVLGQQVARARQQARPLGGAK